MSYDVFHEVSEAVGDVSGWCYVQSEYFCRGPSDVNIRSDIKEPNAGVCHPKERSVRERGSGDSGRKRLIRFWLMARIFGHMKNNHESSKFFLSDCLSVVSLSFPLALFYDLDG